MTTTAIACLHIARVDWGNIPSWVAAVGGVAASLLAFSGWNRQRDDARKQRTRERRAQALQVRIETSWSTGVMTLGEPAFYTANVVVVNDSPEPITSCRLVATVAAKDPSRASAVSEDPTGSVANIGQVPPRGRRGGAKRFIVPTSQPEGMIAVDKAASVTFVDHSGIEWSRDDLGTLTVVLLDATRGHLRLRWPIERVS